MELLILIVDLMLIKVNLKTKLASLFTKYNLFNNKHIPSDFV